MKSVLRAVSVLFILLAILAVAGFQGGNVSSSTVNVIAFNAVTTTGPSAGFQNIGQASHWLTYCVTGTPSTLAIQLEASEDNVSWYAVTIQGTTTTGCGILEAGGYFPYMRADLVTLTGGSSPTVTAYYAGASFPIPGGGLTQLGKTPQLVTNVPASRATCYADSGASISTNCVNFKDSYTNVTLGTGLVLYGMSVNNTAGAGCSITAYDDTTNQPTLWSGRVVPANSTVDFLIPPIGVNITGHLVVFSNVAQGNNTCQVTAFYKGTPIVTTKANSGGTQQSAGRTYP